ASPAAALVVAASGRELALAGAASGRALPFPWEGSGRSLPLGGDESDRALALAARPSACVTSADPRPLCPASPGTRAREPRGLALREFIGWGMEAPHYCER